MRGALVFILLGLLLSSFAFSRSAWGESTSSGFITLEKYRIAYDEGFEDDTDGNGINDRTSYYREGTLVLAARDTDEDGKDDLWFRFDNEEYLDLEVSDLDDELGKDQELSGQPSRRVHCIPSGNFHQNH